jgi:hypothetical protein
MHATKVAQEASFFIMVLLPWISFFASSLKMDFPKTIMTEQEATHYKPACRVDRMVVTDYPISCGAFFLKIQSSWLKAPVNASTSILSFLHMPLFSLLRHLAREDSSVGAWAINYPHSSALCIQYIYMYMYL